MNPRFSLVGPRRWPQWIWTASTIVVPLAVFAYRVGART